jgi:hypothetical protein
MATRRRRQARADMPDGQIRRSQLVGAFAPGSIIDLRSKTGAPLSGVVSGLEAWDSVATLKGVHHPQSIREVRLEKQLNVDGFRLPPVRDEDHVEGKEDLLPVVRFPDFLQCPRCHSVQRSSKWSSLPGAGERTCASCSADGPPVFAVPVRFIVACARGHLEEFPFKMWCGCRCSQPKLYLETRGAGLAGKVLSCRQPGCEGKPASLDGIFGKSTLVQRGLECCGFRPWLPGAPAEQCDEDPRVLQRGASNVYWGEIPSSLDIPPFCEDTGVVFGRELHHFEAATPNEWPAIISVLKLPKMLNRPAEVLLELLKEYFNATKAAETESLQFPEYEQFRLAAKERISKGQFDAGPAGVMSELAPWISTVVSAYRLREVRAVAGFTRIFPPSGPFKDRQTKLALLSITRQNWLPAIELRGEGIFLSLSGDRLRTWENDANVVAWCAALAARVKGDLREEEEMPDCSPRMLLIHSLSHALIRQLSLDCGYSSSALRERIYCGKEPTDMAGLLIHTGSTDSEGTLGGLVRQSLPERLGPTIVEALRALEWCSSDPLCISGAATLSSPRNGAACHSCLLLPETSCTHFNVQLDRALLVGTPKAPALGFFHGLRDLM